MPSPIFREEALREILSPEELERPFRLVRAPAWLTLLTAIALLAVLLAWGILGRVPENAEGAGVLVTPGRVRVLDTPFGGQILRLPIRGGQSVQAGDLLAELVPPEVPQQLQLARDRLQEYRTLDASQQALELARDRGEAELRIRRKELLERSIAELQSLSKDFDTLSDSAIKTRRETVLASQEQSRLLGSALRDRLDSLRRLREKNLITAEALLAAETSLLENEQRLADLDLRRTDFELRSIEMRQTTLQQRHRIADLTVQITELEVQATSLKQELTRMRIERENRLREQIDLVKLLESRLEERSKIRSPFAGRILEVAMQPGQTALPGARLGTLELPATESESAASLVVLTYFPVAAGKRVREGMEALVTPTTVQRERYGSIRGRVTRVAPFPVTQQAAIVGIGNPELLQGLQHPGGMIEVEITLNRADSPSGYEWTSQGPDESFSAGTTARVRIAVEERSPLSYVLPGVRRWLDGDTAPNPRIDPPQRPDNRPSTNRPE
ncbi:NHLP bacteriocin system secretion protein [Tuwongella immobilis]|uniref:Secretion protein: Secretion protein HlyD n=1 Tax=Tuwongella immobilis TaxID=692036 RepID=A0A6C2YL92_9BACT|nr:NHLP bacteriocin system secretion protein [Tuwongella immobilis]VIP01883.1 secretion protein : Secretion protein HlyD OS=Nostoc punctiforme (strain ATCC 29133 / PCC 73102) GN=Npun_F5048 PE=4 SV=1 [Tuwongella immobilis]VTR99737.1 secretion protein : Secretion protein HlyD OS=Nostoc punctiforme (strain ATCC 29133 / PCC 73102) GN=Npun_F5048 PE=4 SV=1 [Tuwongella immobilis]